MVDEACRAIEIAIKDLFRRFVEHDVAGIEAVLHPHCTIWDVFVPDLICGRDARLSYHDADQRQSRARGPLTLEIRNMLIDQWDDTGIARYYVHFSYRAPNAITGVVRVTSVMRRHNGAWLVIHHHEGMTPSGLPSTL